MSTPIKYIGDLKVQIGKVATISQYVILLMRTDIDITTLQKEKIIWLLKINYPQGERLMMMVMMIYMLPCCYEW